MKEKTYVNIQSWMRTELGLSGNELIAYALIYGFCQDGETCFRGSMGYIAYWLGTTRQGAIKIMKRLVEKGAVERIEEIQNGVMFVKYRSLQGVNKVDIGCKQSIHEGCKESLHNNDNIYNNNKKHSVIRFVPPALDEIEQFCKERGNGVDAKRVFDYYSSANWKDGRGNPVRNWKQKIIAVWEKPKEESKVGKVAHEREVYDKDFNEDGTFRW